MSLDFRTVNSLWASVLVETLVRLGLETAVISPGSRSTPLTLACAQHPQLEAIPILDERSASFFALGIAKRSGGPVLLVCTSGTAGANYFPAVIEAKESRVPLLVLTADRPPELRHCASGQTIDQQKLFGHFPVAYAECALPEASLAQLRYLRQTLQHLWQRSQSGPVHLNCPFRDPLAPVAESSVTALQNLWDPQFFDHISPQPSSSPAVPLPPDLGHSHGVIIVGPTSPSQALCRQIARLSSHLGWPVLAEGLSPLRSRRQLNPGLITTYEAVLRQPRWAEKLAPRQVLQVGPLPTSKVLRQWLAAHDPLRWVVGETGENLDPLHGRVRPLPTAAAGLQENPALGAGIANTAYLELWRQLELQVRQGLEQHFQGLEELREAKLPWLLARNLPQGTPVFVANSMPVRDVEWFWPTTDRAHEIFFSRGANGIDGTLSTAMGIVHGYRAGVLLSGDLALLHDTNGFLSGPHLRGHLTVVLVNNHGGGIFERLPVAQFEPPFEQFFATPQAVDFAQLAAAYGTDYELIAQWPQLAARLKALPECGVRVLEVRCDRKLSHQHREHLLNTAADISVG